MNNLKELSVKYNECQDVMDKITSEASYFESVLLNYKGVECYVDNLSLYFGKVRLRVNQEDLCRFEGNCKTVEITVEEFDEEVEVIEED